MTELNQQPGQRDVRSLTEKMQDAIVRAGNSLADLPQDGADLPIDRRSRLLAWTILLLFFLMLLTLAVVLLFERSSSSRRLFYVAIPMIYAVLLASGFVLNRKRADAWRPLSRSGAALRPSGPRSCSTASSWNSWTSSPCSISPFPYCWLLFCSPAWRRA
jgi:hypothetical protein